MTFQCVGNFLKLTIKLIRISILLTVHTLLYKLSAYHFVYIADPLLLKSKCTIY